MRHLFICLIFFTVLASCRQTRDDVSGSSNMAGKVYLLNPYDSFPPQVRSGQMVLLRRRSDSTSASYMFSTTTDPEGVFIFNYLYSDSTYKLHVETRHTTRWDNDILYTTDSSTRPKPGIQLTMQPDTITQNGLFVICQDTVTVGPPGIIPGDSIFIYESSVLAREDSDAIVGDGASSRIVANMAGKALKMNLPFDRPLYINSACTYGGKRYTSKLSSRTLRKTGIDTIWVRLESK